MRTFLITSILLALCLSVAARDIYIYPGLYGTWGAFADHSEFNDDFTSREFSGYLTLSNNDKYFFSLGASDLTQTGSNWDYEQQFYIAGFRAQRYPYALLLHFGYADGQLYFDNLDNSLNPPLTGHLYSAELQRWLGSLLAGFQAYSYHQSTFDNTIGQGFRLRLYRPLTNHFALQLAPVYTWSSDNRRLAAISAEVFVKFSRSLQLTLSGMTGERLFAFDNDLLVLDNQYGALQQRASAKLRYRLTRALDLTGQYIASEYDSYDVDYLVFGLSMRKLIAR